MPRSFFFVLALAACGGGKSPPPSIPPAPSANEAPVAVPPAASTALASTSAVPIETARVPPPPPNPGSTKVSTKTEPTWATCHQTYRARNKDVAKDVAEMAAACAKVTKMKLVGKTLTGKQSDQDPPQTFPFQAEANHCYRVYAQATEGIKDLDLAIKDGAGAMAGEDATDDPSPVLLEDGAICFKEADSATVVVSVGMGNGAYALEIWRD